MAGLFGLGDGGPGGGGGAERDKSGLSGVQLRTVASLKISAPTVPLAVAIISVGGRAGGEGGEEEAWEEEEEDRQLREGRLREEEGGTRHSAVKTDKTVILVHFANGDLVLVSAGPNAAGARVQVVAQGVLNVQVAPPLKDP